MCCGEGLAVNPSVSCLSIYVCSLHGAAQQDPQHTLGFCSPASATTALGCGLAAGSSAGLASAACTKCMCTNHSGTFFKSAQLLAAQGFSMLLHSLHAKHRKAGKAGAAAHLGLLLICLRHHRLGLRAGRGLLSCRGGLGFDHLHIVHSFK